MSKYIVQTAAAKMPVKCWGKYCRVAVIEVEEGVEAVSMISARAKGVVRIVRVWEKCHVGTTARCEYQRVLATANKLASELNNAKAGV